MPTPEIALSAPLTITAADPGGNGGPAKPRRFDMVAYTGGPMKLKGWNHPVIVDLAGVSGLDRARPIFLGHDDSKIVGHADKLGIRAGRMTAGHRPDTGDDEGPDDDAGDGGELWASGIMSGAGDAAREVLAAHDNGFPWQASIGARPDSMQFVERGQKATANGRTFAGPVNIARKTTLGEISFVPVGADENTKVAIAATATKQRNPMQTDEVTMTDETTIERERAASIARICAKYPALEKRANDIQAQALAEGWTANETELHLLRACRPQFSTSRRTASDMPEAGKVIEASLCLSTGLSERFVGRFYDARAIDAAMTSGARNMGLHGLIRATIRAAGRDVPDRIDSDAIRAAFEADRMIRADGSGGYSTMSLGGILSNVQNKLMLSSYESVPTTWDTWCAVGPVKDFKPSLRLRLVGSGGFAPVPESGEIKNSSLQDQSYSVTATTEGAIIVISRQSIINDDQSALQQIPSVLGRQAAIAIERAVYKTLLANTGSFFGTGNGNYASGAGSALSIAALTIAEQKMLEQVDDNGDPILLRPSVLLVPPALKATAENLFNGANLVVSALGSTAAKSLEPNVNAFVSRYLPQVSPWLGEKANLDGASDSAWYLMADPTAGVSPLEVVFLNGQRAPMIETGTTNFDTLGIQTRAYLDFGVGLQDYRAGVLSAGE